VNNKSKSEMKQFRAIVTIEFAAPDRPTALARAKELYASEHSKVRVQESSVAWITVADTPATPTS